MEMLSRVNKIFIFILFNALLILLLYNIPINSEILTKTCVFKNITGRPCFNCGMTRAFLSIIHVKFQQAYEFNHRVIIVFPLSVVVYLYSWIKYITKGDELK